jgi:hypothetical protein
MRLPPLFDVRWLVVLSLAVLGGGCSLLKDLSADQCELDSDCDAQPQFKGRQCVAGVCLGKTIGGGGGHGGSSGDDSSGGSSATSGSDGGAPSGGKPPQGGDAGAAPVAECATNAECLDKNFDPSICMNGSCVPLLSDDCPVILPVTEDLWNDNLRTQSPIIFGAFAHIPSTLIGDQIRNYDLALTEFTHKVNGLPGSGSKRRGLVAVVCRAEYATTANLDAAAAHLVDDLKVPGIIAGLLADDLQHVFDTKVHDADVMMMSPLESDSTLVSLKDDGLIWQMLPGGGPVAVSYSPLVDRTVDHLVGNGTLSDASDTVRVALVTATDLRFLQDQTETIIDTVKFNGKSVADNLNDGNFKSIGITSVYGDKNANLTPQIQAVLDFKPHIIIADAADEFLSKMIPAIESGWAGAAGSQGKPFYLLSPYHFNNPALTSMLQSNPTVRVRMVGVNVASAVDQKLYNSYQIAFDAAYPEVVGDRGYENFYDAAYYLIYSAAAAGNVATLSGDDLARGMGRLLSGPAFGVGQTDIPNALSALQSSAQAKITLNGTDGPPAWDPGTGGKVGPGSIWCVDSGLKQRADVLRYDDTSKTLTGTFPSSCFSGF